MSVTALKVEKIAPLKASGIKVAEHMRNVFSSTADAGVKRGDLLSPAYWSNVAMHFRPWDMIEVRAEDGSFFGRYLVRNADRTWARVYELEFVSFELQKLTSEELDKLKDEYDIKLRGPKGWTVIRKNGNSVIHEGEHAREDAESWLMKFLESQSIVTA